MARIAIIGNAGGGKSTLARQLANKLGTRHTEIDSLLWQEGWIDTPLEVYRQRHADIIAEDHWVIDGLGRADSIPERLDRATDIVLIDMPLWMHFWLAAERQIAWVLDYSSTAPVASQQCPPPKPYFKRCGMLSNLG